MSASKTIFVSFTSPSLSDIVRQLSEDFEKIQLDSLKILISSDKPILELGRIFERGSSQGIIVLVIKSDQFVERMWLGILLTLSKERIIPFVVGNRRKGLEDAKQVLKNNLVVCSSRRGYKSAFNHLLEVVNRIYQNTETGHLTQTISYPGKDFLFTSYRQVLQGLQETAQKALTEEAPTHKDFVQLFLISAELFLVWCRHWLADETIPKVYKDDIKADVHLIGQLYSAIINFTMSKELKVPETLLDLPLPEFKVFDRKEAEKLVKMGVVERVDDIYVELTQAQQEELKSEYMRLDALHLDPDYSPPAPLLDLPLPTVLIED